MKEKTEPTMQDNTVNRTKIYVDRVIELAWLVDAVAPSAPVAAAVSAVAVERLSTLTREMGVTRLRRMAVCVGCSAAEKTRK